MKQFIISLILVMAVVFGMKHLYINTDNYDGNIFSQFDYKVFIIISTISFMIIYKVVQYLASLKIKESHSRIDIVFMLFIILFMFIPMSNINKSIIHQKEKRVLAEYKPFIDNGKINFNYGEEFGEWFNDRFYLRDKFIKQNSKFNRFLNGKNLSDKGLVGRDGWLYIKYHNSVAMFQNDNLFHERDLVRIEGKIEKFDYWIKRRNAKLYVLLVPDKETIYPEFYPENYRKINDISRMQQLVEMLEEKTIINFVYPYNELMEAKKKQKIYHKTGTHWNNIGAHIAYKALFSRIKQDFPELKVYEKDELEIKKENRADTDIASLLQINVNKEYGDDDLLNDIYYPKNPNYNKEEIDFKDNLRGHFYHYKNKDKSKKLKAFLFTDSFFNEVKDYAALSFDELKINFVGGGNDFMTSGDNGKIINDYDFDIFIIATTERFLHRFLNLDVPNLEEDK